jgi:hypothetical protein
MPNPTPWRPNGAYVDGWDLAYPQPGTFDATKPQANPVAVNQDPQVPNKGKPVVIAKNTDGSTRTVNGTVAGVTINNPA